MSQTTTRSFIPVSEESHFPIQNLPYGAFQRLGNPAPRIGTAIGDWILDLSELETRGLLQIPGGEHCFRNQATLNAFMGLGRTAWSAARKRITQLLDEHEPTLRDNRSLRDELLVPMAEVQMTMPVNVPDYTDFYSSRHHATNVGTMLRGADNALQENWLHLPVAYHGRASSVVVSGTDIRRPCGQVGAGKFGPTRALDFELEMGFFVGTGSQLGKPLSIATATDHIFGLVLVNDWSARDIQKWEYVPLGPFLSKSFATTISPWIVTLDALMPFRTPKPPQDPKPLPYLNWDEDFLFDIQLELALQTAGDEQSETITRSNSQNLYWTMAQQLAHHAVSGCNMRPGDLLASGTISGPEKESRGCLLELTWRGDEPLKLANGQTRVFLEDDDQVTLTGWCQAEGYRVGFGEAGGRILPALSS